LSLVQFPVEWDPGATCPNFDGWLAEMLPDPDSRHALLEDLGTVLDLRGYRQKRAVFLIGPTRSGKSTLARIMEATVGTENCSAEELYDLSTNRFRAAELFAKVLNVASDIKAEHLVDVATFKKATGADTLSSERKFGQPFRHRFHGLFMWTTNTVPTVGDVSGAYLVRVRPYRFSRSFAGHENPAIEAAMLSELPGILVRLVDGLRRIEARNGYLENDATRREMSWFAARSDRARLFLGAATRRGGWCERRALFRAFVEWCSDNRRAPMSRTKFYEAVEAAGHARTTRQGQRGFAGLTLVDDWENDDEDDTVVGALAHVRELEEAAPFAPSDGNRVQKEQIFSAHAGARVREADDDVVGRLLDAFPGSEVIEDDDTSRTTR
jgi:P4 family phage/plasmid primase-like protien